MWENLRKREKEQMKNLTSAFWKNVSTQSTENWKCYNCEVTELLWSEISIKHIIKDHDLRNVRSHRIEHETWQLDLLSDQLDKSIQQAVNLTSKCVKFLLYSKNCFSYENDHVQLKLSLAI